MPDERAKVDVYIANAAPFAKPILKRIRRAFHEACPDIEERLKWGVPSFEKNGNVGMMAAFKAHIRFGFWRAAELGTAPAMGDKVTEVSDLPPHDALVDLVRRAVALNLSGKKRPRPKARPKPAPEVPPDLAAALKRNAAARATFEGFPPSYRRDYCEWIAEAKQETTRKRRLDTAIQWLSEGKPRNWKYMKGGRWGGSACAR